MKIRNIVVLTLLAAMMAGCAKDFIKPTKNTAFIDGQKLIAQGDYGIGLHKLEQAALDEPDNKEIRTVLARERDAIAAKFLFDADNTRLAGDLDFAEQQYLYVLDLVPNHQRAKQGLETLNLARQHVAAIDYANELLARGDLVGAETAVREVLQENPMQPDARAIIKQINARMVRADKTGLVLKTAFKKPLTIEFRDTDLKSVFELMSKTAGINFIFDKDIRKETKVSIFVRDNSIEDVLKILLMTNQLAYKQLNDNTLLIYPNTPAKKKEYKELVVRSFHIAHTEVKQMVAMIRGLVKAKDLYVNEKLNLFIMRDTQEAVDLVARLVALNDLPEPEVMLDIEVIEIQRNRLMELGPKLPTSLTYRHVLTATGGVGAVVPFSTIQDGVLPGGGRVEGIIQGKKSLSNFAIPNDVLVNFKKTLTQGDLLANPRIRVRNREKAKVLIGDRIPYGTSNVSGTSNIVTQNVQFIEVGLKLDVEPIISLSDEVAIKVALEVSNRVADVAIGDGSTGSTVPQVGTRTAETLLTIRDGDTQVLAGLINDRESNIYTGIPGLIDLPVFRRLFTDQNLNREKSEIILLITPRIIRNNIRPTNLESEFHFGTANNAGKLPIRISKTKASSLALSASSSGGRGSAFRRGSNAFEPARNVPNPFARAIGANASAASVSIAAPKNVGLDKEFSVRIRLAGAKASVTSELEMSYDSDMLELLDGGDKSGARTLKLGKGEKSGMSAQLRFKVITANPGTADISVQSVTAEDKDSGDTVDVTLPPTASINIQP